MSRLVPAEEQLVLLNSNTTLILKTNIFLFFVVEGTSHGPFQRQCFQDYFDSTMDVFSASKKDQAFLYDKVVITQSDACD